MLRVLLSLALALCLPVRGATEQFSRGPAMAIRNFTHTAGHCRVEVKEGQAAPLLLDGQRRGILLSGKGLMRFVSTDPLEARRLVENTRRLADLQPTPAQEGVQLELPFEAIALWDSAEFAPSAGAPASEAALDGLLAILKDRHTHLAKQNLAQEFKLHSMNTPQARFACFETIQNGRILGWSYRYDQGRRHEEALYALRKPKSDEVPDVLPILVSRVPLGWTHKSGIGAPFRLSDLQMELVAPGGARAEVRAQETVVPAVPGQRALRFQMEGRQVSWGASGAYAYHPYRVKEVKDATGAALPFDQDDSSVVVFLPEPAAVGQPLNLSFRMEGNILLLPPDGSRIWRFDSLSWLPMPEWPGMAFTFRGTLKTKKPFVPIVPGDTLRRGEEGDWLVHEARISVPVDFVSLVAGNFQTVEEQHKGRTVRVSTYAMGGLNARSLAKLALGISDFYEYLLAPFPFKELNIVQYPSYGFGQAPAGLIYMTNETFSQASDPRDDMMRKIFSKGINHRFAHEIAHQYWGQMLKMPSWEEQWLTESFAEFCSALCLDILKIRGNPSYEDAAHAWHTEAQRHAPLVTIPFANELHSEDVWEDMSVRKSLIYSKGALLLHDLRRQTGDKAFFAVLRHLLKSHPFGFGTTQEFQEALEQATGKPFGPYFDRYFWGTELPEWQPIPKK